MNYALIESRSYGYYLAQLAWGSLQEIATAVLDECDLVLESMWGMSLEQIENEYSCDLDDYKVLINEKRFNHC